MTDILNILRNARIELLVQNEFYETEKIAIGSITSVYINSLNEIKIIFQGREKYYNTGIYIEFTFTLPIYDDGDMKLRGSYDGNNILFQLRNKKTRKLLALAINKKLKIY